MSDITATDSARIIPDRIHVPNENIVLNCDIIIARMAQLNPPSAVPTNGAAIRYFMPLGKIIPMKNMMIKKKCITIYLHAPVIGFESSRKTCNSGESKFNL